MSLYDVADRRLTLCLQSMERAVERGDASSVMLGPVSHWSGTESET